jgi:ribosomal protein S6--L-glutamate ligase
LARRREAAVEPVFCSKNIHFEYLHPAKNSLEYWRVIPTIRASDTSVGVPVFDSEIIPMQCVSFDAFRTLGLPATRYIKPQEIFRHKQEIASADWVLFPEYWQLGAVLFGLKGRIFPSLASYLIGHDKVEMTRAFMTVAPANIPWTLIEPNTDSGAERIWANMPLPFVAKLPKASMGRGVWLIRTIEDWNSYRAQTDVLYAQEYLPIDRDLRIIVVGEKVVGGFWRLQGFNGFHNNLSQGGTVDQDAPLPESAVALALQLAHALEINHAGFDIAMVDGHPYVLEFNRLFGNTGLPGLSERVRAAILEYLMSQDRSGDPTDPVEPTPPLKVAV